jgi:ribosome biogenesis protein MAK21
LLIQPSNIETRQMGKKRTHAETKDGFNKPPPEHNRVSVKHDRKDKRRNGEVHKSRAQLVCDFFAMEM